MAIYTLNWVDMNNQPLSLTGSAKAIQAVIGYLTQLPNNGVRICDRASDVLANPNLFLKDLQDS